MSRPADLRQWRRQKQISRLRYWSAWAKAKGLSFQEVMRRVREVKKKGAYDGSV